MDDCKKKSCHISLKPMLGIIITAVVAGFPLAALIWMLGPERFLGTFIYALSGQLFGDPWNRIHAGFTLDQPTIGKWYFWFTVFTVMSLPYMTLVRRFCIRCSRLRHWIFALGLTVLCSFLICLLTIPFFWLVQYIHEMGWTQKRIFGLLYGIAGYVAVLGFYIWAARPQKTELSSK
ncbi:MAG: hypothetical protein DRP52_02730 [Planctomycetota bacterium]|nr:MAG: hypothetical protein DRP52_02730 [Planctomycetota bacterium]